MTPRLRARATATRRDFVIRSALATAALAVRPVRRAWTQPAPASAGPADSTLIEDIAAGNRILASHGVLDALGHVAA